MAVKEKGKKATNRKRKGQSRKMPSVTDPSVTEPLAAKQGPLAGKVYSFWEIPMNKVHVA